MTARVTGAVERDQLRVVLLMANFAGYFRNFEPALRVLLQRGHSVHVGVEREGGMDGVQWADDLREEHPAFSWSRTPGLKLDEWYSLNRNLRLALDYMQVLRPAFGAGPELAGRAERRAQPALVRLLRFAPLRSRPVLAAIGRLLETIEGAIPPSTALTSYLDALEPHVVLLTPHLMPGSSQTWSLRSAQSLGVPTALCIASWDNLSSKQLIRLEPEAVTVWNETQKREAVEIHGIDPGRVVVTGAQVYDHWFDWQARPREEFCAKVGLPPDRPIVLYAAGALFPAEITESQFVPRWIRALRESGQTELREASILIRPHPKRLSEWQDAALSDFENVACWPRDCVMPVSSEDKADYFDSIYHSAAVVGVNTSAMIEAGIVGRRVHAVLVPEFSGSQGGVFHFRYLTEVAGGLLRVGRSLDEHLEQLGQSLRSSSDASEENRPFLEEFVRPRGIERPSAPIFADTVERLAVMEDVRIWRPSPAARRAWPLLLRLSRRLAVADRRAMRRRKGLAPEGRRRGGRGRRASRVLDSTPAEE